MKDLDKSKETVPRLRPIDDTFSQERVACQEALRVILEDSELTVEEIVPQDSVKDQQGHSVTLDVLCKRGDGSFFNIEVQKQSMPII